MKRTLAFALVVPLLAAVGAGQGQKKDVWEPLRFLEGTWEGRGEGGSGASTVVQEYRFVLGGNFLRMTTRSEFKPQEKNPEGEVHEDLGLFSYDAGRKVFVLRGFYVEGFVNRYVGQVSEDGQTLTFETEAVENAPPGTRAKLLFLRKPDGGLEQSFHVAWPNRDYAGMSTNYLKRKAG